jgi:hypothetical protein
MRAKNEFKFIAEAYDTKLILERIVDGKLMCPEACCGAPVIECTCGEDCPHCNCFMIHKAMKDKDFTNKLLKEGSERPYDINDPSTHYVVKTVGGQHGQIRGPVIFQGSLKDIVAKFGDAVDDPNDPNNWFEGELGIGEDAVVVSADPSDDFSSVEAYRAARGIRMPSDEDAESDAGLWRDQMKHQSKVSPEELERIKKQKPAPQGRLTMPGDKDRDDTRTLKEMQRDIMNGMTAKESMEGMGIHPANQKSLLAKYMEFSKGSEGPIETGFEDNEEIDIGTMVTWNQDGPMKGEVVDVDVEQGFAVIETGFGIPPEKYVVDLGELTKAIPRKPRGFTGPIIGQLDVEAAARERLRQKYGEDNEEPRRGISGYEHKTDALVSASKEKQKPYVTSYKDDRGERVFDVLDAHGTAVYRTGNKLEAWKWLKSNFDQLK